MNTSTAAHLADGPVEIFGRRSSLFTRVALVFAESLGVSYQLTHIADMAGLDSNTYGGHPALRMPLLRDGDHVVIGTENICRALASRSVSAEKVVWPEHVSDPVLRNAQELVWQCM